MHYKWYCDPLTHGLKNFEYYIVHGRDISKNLPLQEIFTDVDSTKACLYMIGPDR